MQTRTVTAPRIASLVPSLTELVAALGLGAQLVARTGFCIHPREAVQVPKVGGTKDVNLAKLERLRPTHVLVNIDENRLDTFVLQQTNKTVKLRRITDKIFEVFR